MSARAPRGRHKERSSDTFVRGERRNRKHSGVRACVHSELVKTGVLQQAWGRFYDQLFYDRQQADYVELVGLEASDVQGALDKTTEPVAILEGLWLRRGER